MQVTTNPLQTRGIRRTLAFLGMLLLVVGASVLLEFEYGEALIAFPDATV